jgi:hypothetical protein
LTPWPITERDDSTCQFVTNGEQIADLVRPRLGTARMADQMQIRQFCLRQHDRHRGYERMFELRRG